MGNDFQWSSETEIPLCLFCPPCGTSSREILPLHSAPLTRASFPPSPAAIRGKTTHISYCLAESPWLRHLMCSCYVIGCNECFIYLLYLSCSYILRVERNKAAGLYIWPRSDQSKQRCHGVIAGLLALQGSDIFSNIKCY